MSTCKCRSCPGSSKRSSGDSAYVHDCSRARGYTARACTKSTKKDARVQCAVVGCGGSERVQSSHVVPQDQELWKIWLWLIRLPLSDIRKFIYICGRHFFIAACSINSHLLQTMGFERRQQLRPDVVPALHLCRLLRIAEKKRKRAGPRHIEGS